MPLSIYEVSVPLFVRAFDNLSAIIDKAVAYAEARRFDPGVLVDARLYPDMGPFSFQIQRASDTAKSTTARLAGVDVPSFADEEKTIDELKERIAKTRAFITGVPANAFEGAEDRVLTVTVRGNSVEMRGRDWLLSRQIPNFYFHITTAYDILRHNGIEIGKRDYLG